MNSLLASFNINASAMKAQSTKMRVIGENIANIDNIPTNETQTPYRRKQIIFKSVLDKVTNQNLIQVDKVISDTTPFKTEYKPSHPAANKDGYIRMPNISSMIELNDYKLALKAYKANLSAIEVGRDMLLSAIQTLK